MNDGILRVGDQHPLHRADAAADHQADDDDDRIGPLLVDHQRAGDRADEADRRADRQIDVAADDDQQHAQRHDDDVGVLHHQIGDVDRRDRGVILGDEIEEADDQQQRHEQAVVAQIVPPQLRPHLLGGGGGRGDGGRAHDCVPYWRMIDAMIFSWLASLAGISSTNRPSFIT